MLNRDRHTKLLEERDGRRHDRHTTFARVGFLRTADLHREECTVPGARVPGAGVGVPGAGVPGAKVPGCVRVPGCRVPGCRGAQGPECQRAWHLAPWHLAPEKVSAGLRWRQASRPAFARTTLGDTLLEASEPVLVHLAGCGRDQEVVQRRHDRYLGVGGRRLVLRARARDSSRAACATGVSRDRAPCTISTGDSTRRIVDAGSNCSQLLNHRVSACVRMPSGMLSSCFPSALRQ